MYISKFTNSLLIITFIGIIALCFHSESLATPEKIKTTSCFSELAKDKLSVNDIHHVVIEKAVPCLEEKLRHGDPESAFNLGLLHLHGMRFNRDEKKALELFLYASRRGVLDATYNAALMYEAGKGVKSSLSEALRLLRKAASGGHLPASFNYGMQLIRAGRAAEGETWLRKAAAGGYPEAFFYIGQQELKNGNSQAALGWYLKSANAGDARAPYNLGVIYQSKGTQEAADQAIKWYKIAAGSGDVGAKYNLALMYLKSRSPTDAEVIEAIEMLRDASNQGHFGAKSVLLKLNLVK